MLRSSALDFRSEMIRGLIFVAALNAVAFRCGVDVRDNRPKPGGGN